MKAFTVVMVAACAIAGVYASSVWENEEWEPNWEYYGSVESAFAIGASIIPKGYHRTDGSTDNPIVSVVFDSGEEIDFEYALNSTVPVATTATWITGLFATGLSATAPIVAVDGSDGVAYYAANTADGVDLVGTGITGFGTQTVGGGSDVAIIQRNAARTTTTALQWGTADDDTIQAISLVDNGQSVAIAGFSAATTQTSWIRVYKTSDWSVVEKTFLPGVAEIRSVWGSYTDQATVIVLAQGEVRIAGEDHPFNGRAAYAINMELDNDLLVENVVYADQAGDDTAVGHCGGNIWGALQSTESLDTPSGFTAFHGAGSDGDGISRRGTVEIGATIVGCGAGGGGAWIAVGADGYGLDQTTDPFTNNPSERSLPSGADTVEAVINNAYTPIIVESTGGSRTYHFVYGYNSGTIKRYAFVTPPVLEWISQMFF